MIPFTLAGFLFWALIVLGLVYLGTAAEITAVPRRFVYLLVPKWIRGVLACAPCFAFWVGAVLGGFGSVPFPWGPAAWSFGVVVAMAIVGGIMSTGFVAGFQGLSGWYIAEYDIHETESEQAGSETAAGEEAAEGNEPDTDPGPGGPCVAA